MDDGEIEFSNQDMLPSFNFGELQECNSMDGIFDEIFTDVHACIHTHTCNPPGPDNAHTHTCYHVHHKVVPPSSEDKILSDDTAESAEKIGKKRPLSNKESVRKYRLKKKAQTASLEDQIVRLMARNQELEKRLQDQAVLEAENARLKCLLVDIRGRIEGEIGSFPYQKPMAGGDIYQNLGNANHPGAHLMNPCNLQCDDQVYCLPQGSEELNGQGFNSCGFETLPGCALGVGTPTTDASCKNQKKGGKRAAVASRRTA